MQPRRMLWLAVIILASVKFTLPSYSIMELTSSHSLHSAAVLWCCYAHHVQLYSFCVQCTVWSRCISELKWWPLRPCANLIIFVVTQCVLRRWLITPVIFLGLLTHMHSGFYIIMFVEQTHLTGDFCVHVVTWEALHSYGNTILHNIKICRMLCSYWLVKGSHSPHSIMELRSSHSHWSNFCCSILMLLPTDLLVLCVKHSSCVNIYPAVIVVMRHAPHTVEQL